MTASQPATPGSDGEVCACGHRLAHHVSVGGCCIGACLCLVARPAAPSEPPAEVPAYIRSPALLRDPLLRPQPSEPPAETQQDEEPCCTIDGGGRCNDCPALAARPSADTETLLPVRAEIIRQVREAAWHDGYEACRRGDQPHNPYRAALDAR